MNVNDLKFFNKHQPQTLQSGVILCYIEAVFGLLGVAGVTSIFMQLLIVAGLAGGGFGIANEKKWGYSLAVAAAIVQVLVLVLVLRGDVLSFYGVITFMFDGVLVALLLHPMSRDYQRIWFR